MNTQPPGQDPVETPAERAGERSAELAWRLDRVRRRIVAACASVGRDPAQVALIAVTKFFPATDLVHLHALGMSEVGESRDQDAGPKLQRLAELDPGARTALRVHFVGQIQTNKATSIARYADVIHSVDRVRLVDALAKGAALAERVLDVLIQVDLEQDGDSARAGGHHVSHRDGRGGAHPEHLAELAERIAGADSLRLAGLMAVAPRATDPGPHFERLWRLHERLRTDHPEADVLSAGMSEDLEAAIAHGATHLRVGTAILGSRPTAR